MSISITEREQFRRDFDRANKYAWDHARSDEAKRIQAANPGMTFERAWDQAEREQRNPDPEPETIGEAAKLVHAQNPTWTFERSWRHAETIHPELVKSATAEENRATKLAPQQDREKWQTQARVESVARALMAKEPGLPFGVALIRARGEEVKAAPATATLTRTTSVDTVEPKPRMMLIKGHEASYVD
jgi:hypothetical protein